MIPTMNANAVPLKSKHLTIVFIYLLVNFTYLVVLLGEHQIVALNREDGPIESVGAIFFVVAAGLFLITYFRSQHSVNSPHFFYRRQNFFYLFLGALLFLCFLEEISWGQRLFRWETPAWLMAINQQGETNIHNIAMFHKANTGPDGIEKSALAVTLNMNRLFSIFWLVFCVVVPLLNRISLRARHFFKQIRIPIAPLWIGGLFVSHAIVFHVVYNFATDLRYSTLVYLNELKEANYAFVFLLFAITQLRRHRNLPEQIDREKSY